MRTYHAALCCCLASFSSVRTPETGKEQNKLVTKTPANFSPVLWQWRTNAFSKDLKTLQAGKDWYWCQEKSLDGCNENWNWGKQMAEEECQPGSLCQALGLKFQPELFFSWTKLGKGRKEGEGKRGERIPCSNCLLNFFYLSVQNVAKLQCCLLV